MPSLLQYWQLIWPSLNVVQIHACHCNQNISHQYNNNNFLYRNLLSAQPIGILNSNYKVSVYHFHKFPSPTNKFLLSKHRARALHLLLYLYEHDIQIYYVSSRSYSYCLKRERGPMNPAWWKTRKVVHIVIYPSRTDRRPFLETFSWLGCKNLFFGLKCSRTPLFGDGN